MTVRTWLGVGLLWVLSLVAVGSIVTAAQIPIVKPVPPKVLAGPDVGFRVEATEGDRVVGQIVVKVNDKWVEATLGTPRTSAIKPLK
jgi:hypothetical protein